MEPIATYKEVRFDGSRTFTLFPDKLLVRGKTTLHSDFDTTIPLRILDPNFDRMGIRNKSCSVGAWIATISFVTWTVLVKGFGMSFAAPGAGMIAMGGVAGLLLSAATFRKVEFLRFRNQSGLHVLDIARSGKDAEQLDSFVQVLVKQIEASKA